MAAAVSTAESSLLLGEHGMQLPCLQHSLQHHALEIPPSPSPAPASTPGPMRSLMPQSTTMWRAMRVACRRSDVAPLVTWSSPA